MFIYNFKFNLKKIIITCIVIAVIIALTVELIAMYKDKKKAEFDYVLNTTNFTNTLRDVHNNIDENIGKTIKISGFVFTMPDFKEGYFVCGRNMILDSDEKVVGFLCNYKDINNFKESQWIEITGHFVKGYYMSDMPIIQVDTIKAITAPTNSYVNAPTVDKSTQPINSGVQ